MPKQLINRNGKLWGFNDETGTWFEVDFVEHKTSDFMPEDVKSALVSAIAKGTAILWREGEA
jgi:hypothetical protein